MGAFAELRGVCVKQGSPLTRDFLDLEREIDSFAGQYADRLSLRGRRTDSLSVGAYDYPIGKARRPGRTAYLDRREGTALREKAAQDCFGLTWPGRAEQAGTAGA
jgi:hypothetical protein